MTSKLYLVIPAYRAGGGADPHEGVDAVRRHQAHTVRVGELGQVAGLACTAESQERWRTGHGRVAVAAAAAAAEEEAAAKAAAEAEQAAMEAAEAEEAKTDAVAEAEAAEAEKKEGEE